MKKIPKKKLFLVILVAAVLVSAAFGAYKIIEERKNFVFFAAGAYENLSSVMRSIRSGDQASANESIRRLVEDAGKLENNSFFRFFPFLARETDVISSLRGLTEATGVAVEMRRDFRTDFAVAVFTDGEEARGIIGRLYSAVNKIVYLGSAFRNQASVIGAFSGSSDYLAVQSELVRSRALLLSAKNLIAEDGEVLFILLDEREATPGGGAVADYAFLPLEGGRIIASRPIVLSGGRDEAALKKATGMADFNFSASAVYAALGIEKRPAAIIALNFASLKKILKIVGPVELPENGAVLDAGNSREIILKKRGERIFEKTLAALAGGMAYLQKESRSDFSEIIYEAINDGGIQISFADPNLSATSDSGGFVAGDDYLAVSALFSSAEAQFIRGKIEAEAEIRSDGSVDGRAVITRALPEKMKGDLVWSLVLPEAAEIEGVSGGESVNSEGMGVGIPKGLKPESYRSTDKKLAIEYRRTGGRADKYRFIYERYSGTDFSLSLKVRAPAGYVFADSGRGEFLYESGKPPRRLIIDLAIVRL